MDQNSFIPFVSNHGLAVKGNLWNYTL